MPPQLIAPLRPPSPLLFLEVPGRGFDPGGPLARFAGYEAAGCFEVGCYRSVGIEGVDLLSHFSQEFLGEAGQMQPSE
jgi:hypothetical protein